MPTRRRQHRHTTPRNATNADSYSTQATDNGHLVPDQRRHVAP